MTITNGFVSVDSYVSTLLASTNADSTNGSDEDAFESIVDDIYVASDAVDEGFLSLPVSKYLSFAINNMSYIVPYTHVTTVKRINGRDIYNDMDVLDVSHVLGQGSSNAGQYKYAISLKGHFDYVIAVDNVNPVVEITMQDLKLRKSVVSRPWLLGISVGKPCLLIDSYALGSVLAVARQRIEYGTKFAVL